ncbi:MAG: S-adenosylmethionine:tRNA ribosyltransferase-isomerase [Bacteroidales bacterium]|nr:S-adenosylmethionine:tRNA ribosyltransferase-isomerase [Bacteroidales bacterium]
MVKNLRIDDFDYPLPDERIAKHPLALRDSCKLLVRRADGSISDGVFSELPQILPADSMLVYNNTRVINARLRFRKPEGALIEIFCLEPVSPRDYAQSFASNGHCSWICFVGNSKKWKQGQLILRLDVKGYQVDFRADRVGREANASVIEFSWDVPELTFADIIEAAGEIPIPPYLNRSTEASDASDYQTVYSHIDGSVAAPTAGLHFTPRVLDEISDRGIPRRELTLHVGAGTFQPVKSDEIGEHMMHSEFIAVSRSLIDELASTDRRVIAVGTTSVRTLESLYHLGCRAAQGLPVDELPQWYPYDSDHPQLSVADALKALLDRFEGDTFVASTRVIIAPGYRYRIVKGIVTNFHQPRSTLLLLVSAFTGGGNEWRSVYDHALDGGYRFLSYGDACLFIGE